MPLVSLGVKLNITSSRSENVFIHLKSWLGVCSGNRPPAHQTRIAGFEVRVLRGGSVCMSLSNIKSCGHFCCFRCIVNITKTKNKIIRTTYIFLHVIPTMPLVTNEIKSLLRRKKQKCSNNDKEIVNTCHTRAVEQMRDYLKLVSEKLNSSQKISDEIFTREQRVKELLSFIENSDVMQSERFMH